MNKQFFKLAVSVASVGLIALPLSFGFAQTTEPAKPSATPQTAACPHHEQHAGCAHAHRHDMQDTAKATHRHTVCMTPPRTRLTIA
jgi:ABC-type nickel/cobalt efflux system permease component RcnA